jgi:drug/metabolite transporter (DMT)-like permease
MNTITSSDVRDHRQTPSRNRWIGALIAFEAVTLAVAAGMHLSGAIDGGSKPFDASDAGVAEAVICAALAAGATALLRAPGKGRPHALAATGFAVAGFAVGLSFTVRSGDAPDLIYHAIMLPVLIATVILLARPDPGAMTRQREGGWHE